MGVEAFGGHGRRDWKDVAAEAWRRPGRPDGGVAVFAAQEDIERVVPRRLALSLKGTVAPGCSVSAGALARISEAPPQARWSLMMSRHGCQDVSVPLIAMRSSERNPARLPPVPKATKPSFQKNWPFRSLARSRNRGSSGTRKEPCSSILAS